MERTVRLARSDTRTPSTSSTAKARVSIGTIRTPDRPLVSQNAEAEPSWRQESVAAPGPDDQDGAGRMVGDLAGDGSEQKPGKPSVSPGSHNEQIRVFGCFQQRHRREIPNEHSLDVHALSSYGPQRVGLDPFSEVKGVIGAAVFHR